MADEKKPAHVVAAHNEIEYGVRTGSEDAVTRGRKRLNAAGENGEAAVTEARARHATETHAAAAEHRAAAQVDADKTKPETARKTPPQGRTSVPKSQT